MSTRSFFARRRSPITAVAGALMIVGVAGVGTVTGSNPSTSHSGTANASESESTSTTQALPYGIEQSPNGIESLNSQSADGSTPGAPDQSIPADRRGRPGSGSENDSTTNIDRGVKVDSAPGVVLIDTKAADGEGMGTGMALTADGQILTNYHVVEGSEKITVTIADTGAKYTASLLGANPSKDVALLSIPAQDLATVTVSEASVALGETVYAVGNGNGQGFLTNLKGVVTGVNQSIDVSEGTAFGPTVRLSNLIKTNADVVPGYSGGPMLNASGQVIGLNTAASSRGQIDGFATPVTEAMKVVSQIRSGNESGGVRIGPKGALGVQVATDPSVRGAVIVGVPGQSAAGSAGMVRGDIITAINGTAVARASDLADAIGAMEPGTSVTVKWQRASGGTQTAKVTLGESTVN